MIYLKIIRRNKMKKSKYNKFNTPLKILLLKNKGGKTCAKIIEKIIDRPYNINQLANELDIYYNTVHYHIQIMLDNQLVEKKNDDYGSLYEASPKLLNEIDTFNEIKKKI